MEKINAPRGTQDILPQDVWKWHTVERIARETAEVYHFGEIRTPIYESTSLFHRGVGETSDIIQKETFTFKPREDSDSITLRPEGTAGVVRAAIEHGMIAQDGARAKVYYIGANFRYERPQKGRLRIHHQFGAEAFGIANPDQDVECILLQMDFYARCGVKDLALHINSLGDTQSKQHFRDELAKFLQPKADKLSEDSRRRLSTNPLRILDSKLDQDKEACVGAPNAYHSLSEKSKSHFDRVQQLLTDSNIPFTVSSSLVRGFDYYTETLWEVVAGGLGSQNAIGGGGRYDNLVEMLGGRPTPGVGFGSGLERLLLALEGQNVALPKITKPLVWIISLGDAALKANWTLLRDLRAAGIATDMDHGGKSAKSQFKVANHQGAAYGITVGDTELAAGQVVLKNFADAVQVTIDRTKIVEHLLQMMR